MRLDRILSIKRPHGGKGESQLRSMLQKEFGGTVDKAGNLWIVKGQSTTLFVAHMDTVHRDDGKIALTSMLGIVTATDKAGKPCVLGADDGAGVWMLCELLTAGIPGIYLFTVGEERGGIGARHAAKDERLIGLNRAIAFDRRGKTDIIVDQAHGKCASTEFAKALGAALGMGHTPESGIYTDTAEFTSVIPECTNISVGYAHEHTYQESLDTEYLCNLRDAALKVEWEELPVVRDVLDDGWGKVARFDSIWPSDEPNNVDDLYAETFACISARLSRADQDILYDALERAFIMGQDSAWNAAISYR